MTKHVMLIGVSPYYAPGWYYSDETDDLHGPYESEEDAAEALAAYAAWLNDGGTP